MRTPFAKISLLLFWNKLAYRWKAIRSFSIFPNPKMKKAVTAAAALSQTAHGSSLNHAAPPGLRGGTVVEARLLESDPWTDHLQRLSLAKDFGGSEEVLNRFLRGEDGDRNLQVLKEDPLEAKEKDKKEKKPKKKDKKKKKNRELQDEDEDLSDEEEHSSANDDAEDSLTSK
jgi:hypothetical protein